MDNVGGFVGGSNKYCEVVWNVWFRCKGCVWWVYLGLCGYFIFGGRVIFYYGYGG